jgi:hypothetical protein
LKVEVEVRDAGGQRNQDPGFYLTG